MEPDRTDGSEITIDRAREGDGDAIAAIHVAVWRNAYPGILPDRTLTGLSRPRLALHYESAIRRGAHVLVARTACVPRRVVGFATASRSAPGALGEGEVETLYVLDDWREQGIGRLLLAQAARHLATLSCRSVFLWVLSDNPSRWFYEHLGGRPALRSVTQVGGRRLPQVAMVWERIETLAAGT